MAERLKTGPLVYHGFAAHLLPNNLKDVLRVCLIADEEYRIRKMVEEDETTQGRAQQILEKDDLERCQWTQYLFDYGPWDMRLYDLRIPMHTTSIDAATEMIDDGLKKIALQIPADNAQRIEDSILSAAVGVALAKEGLYFPVLAKAELPRLPSTVFPGG